MLNVVAGYIVFSIQIRMEWRTEIKAHHLVNFDAATLLAPSLEPFSKVVNR